MKKLPIRLMRFLVPAMLLISILPARAQQSVVQLPDIYVTSDNYSVHVSHKAGAQPSKVPVLLIHGSWVNSQTWDFPGRSVMDYLAVLGYDVYALDLRGMGGTVPAPAIPTDYFPIDILGRARDAAAVAGYIRKNTGRVPVVIGWSQGGLITGLLAASDPQHLLAAGVGLLSTAPGGFVIPQNLFGDVPRILFSQFPEALAPTQSEIDEIIFGTDPITGKSTISPDALAIFSSPPFLQPDSSITVPALVVDGALDLLVGEDLANTLFESLGSTNKQLIVLPRNSHGWFLEDNHHATMRVFDHFLSQF